MTFKLCSLALLAATAATAQTSKPTVHHTTTAHHTATARTSAKASAIPHVPGIPKTLYALKYIDIRIGKGPLAETHKWYTVHYTGWFPDGTKFDSSFDHPGGEPIVFPCGARRVITGWDTGFEGMHVGGKRRLFIPYQLAYGELGDPPRMPARANLIFDVELVAQSDTAPEPKPEPAPAKPTEPETKPAEPVQPGNGAHPPIEVKPETPAAQPKTPPNPETK